MEFETVAELAFVLNKVGEKNANAIAEATWRQKERLDSVAKANMGLTEKERKNIEDWKASKVKKERRKFGKKRFMIQVAYWGVIYKLWSDGFSYPEIAAYLLRYHKFKVHSTTIERYFVEKMKLMES